MEEIMYGNENVKKTHKISILKNNENLYLQSSNRKIKNKRI